MTFEGTKKERVELKEGGSESGRKIKMEGVRRERGEGVQRVR